MADQSAHFVTRRDFYLALSGLSGTLFLVLEAALQGGTVTGFQVGVAFTLVLQLFAFLALGLAEAWRQRGVA